MYPQTYYVIAHLRVDNIRRRGGSNLFTIPPLITLYPDKECLGKHPPHVYLGRRISEGSATSHIWWIGVKVSDIQLANSVLRNCTLCMFMSNLSKRIYVQRLQLVCRPPSSGTSWGIACLLDNKLANRQKITAL